MLRLAAACDLDQRTIGAVLGMGRTGAEERLRRKYMRRAWLELKAKASAEFGRERRKRWWWRRRLLRIGIDPHTILTSDPLWHACFRLPKGELARRVIVEMRDALRARGAPSPDNLSTDERVAEFCARVEQRKREHFATLYGDGTDPNATRDARMLALLARANASDAKPRKRRARSERDTDQT